MLKFTLLCLQFLFTFALFANTTTVYDDALASDWQNWSWGGNYNFSYTNNAQVGNNAIEAAYTSGYAGLNIRKGTSIDGATVNTIRFWVRSEGTHEISLYTSATDEGEASSSYVFTATPTWQQITVDISQLGSPTTIKRITFQNWSNNTNVTAYFDQIELVGNSTPTNQTDAVLIRVDQFGYLPQAEKVAVLSDPQFGDNANLQYTPPAQLQVRDAATDAVVFTGNVEVWQGGSTHTQSGDKGWWFDFSSLTTVGNYYIYDPLNVRQSDEFSINTTVYDEVMKAAFKMFYYNRCNTPKVSPYVATGYTDGTSFLNNLQDGNARYVNDRTNASLEKDLRGGWFDAGDFNKYVTFTYSVIHNLLWAYEENKDLFSDNWNIPESSNGIPDVLDEVKWELDWLLKMTNSDGSVHLKMGSIDYGDNANTPPSLNIDPRYYGPTCTSASIANAGIFAHAAKVFSNISGMQSYAQLLETNAINTWNYVLPRLNNNTLETACDDGTIKAGDADRDVPTQRAEALTAAIHLFDLTNINNYSQYVSTNINDAEQISSPYWGPYSIPLNDALLLYTTLPNANANTTNTILNAVNTDVANNFNNMYGFNQLDLYRSFMIDDAYHWGSNIIKANYGLMNLQMERYNIAGSSNWNYTKKAKEQLHYFHGVNPLGLVYLSNMYDVGGDNCVNEIYHGWFKDGSVWDNALTSTYGPPPGYLAGGPNKEFTIATLSPPYGEPIQKAYLDYNDDSPLNSWEISEPAIYYQAAYLRLLANYASRCARVLDDTKLGAIVGDSFYAASESIVFSGTVTANSDVSFQAGDYIQLQDGFAASNTNFTAAIGGCGGSTVSEVDDFLEDDKTIETRTADDIELTVAPNPSQGLVQLSYNLTASSPIQIILVDPTGRIVQQIQVANGAIGQQQIELNFTRQPAGFYTLVFKSATQTVARRIVIM